MGSPGIITRVRDLLAALEIQDKHIINNRHCHHVGSSKALQSFQPPKDGGERRTNIGPKLLELRSLAWLHRLVTDCG